MRITDIHLDDDGTPDRIRAELSIAEAAWVATAVGTIAPPTDTTHSLYEALTGSLFNRFWEEGVSGYLRGDKE